MNNHQIVRHGLHAGWVALLIVLVVAFVASGALARAAIGIGGWYAEVVQSAFTVDDLVVHPTERDGLPRLTASHVDN